MSADHYADKDGIFKVLVSDHKTGKVLGRISVDGLSPYAPIYMEIVTGFSDIGDMAHDRHKNKTA